VFSVDLRTEASAPSVLLLVVGVHVPEKGTNYYVDTVLSDLGAGGSTDSPVLPKCHS